MATPFQLSDHISVTAWGLDQLVYVLDGTEAVEVHVGVEDHDLDELLARVAGGVMLLPDDEGYNLAVVRGSETLGHVHRRPGLPSTYTNLLRPRTPNVLGLVAPLPN